MVLTLSVTGAQNHARVKFVRVAEHQIMQDRAVDSLLERSSQENLAMILTMVGQNSRAISILTELLQMPYWGFFFGPAPITPTLLRLDPLWDSLCAAILFSKSSAKKSGREGTNYTNRYQTRIARIITNQDWKALPDTR